jgi:hypothetical protein
MQFAQGFARVAKPNEELLSELGPLKDLVGTWTGNKGFNLIAVPSGPKSFQLEVMPYMETITFSPVGALVPNKDGTPNFMKIPALEYELRVSDTQTNEALHAENGMWLRLNYNVDPNSNAVARLSNVPHGNSLVAIGKYSEITGPPHIPDMSSLPDTGSPMPLGYTDPYLTPDPGFPNFHKGNPNSSLRDAIQGQTIIKTTVLEVSTQPDGGIVNIPYIVKHADARAFRSTFWIETVQTPTGNIMQLQYSQQADLFFLPRFGPPPGLIKWPHVDINTLLKQ